MKSLFDPIQIKHLNVKNRLVRSATWEGIFRAVALNTSTPYSHIAPKCD